MKVFLLLVFFCSLIAEQKACPCCPPSSGNLGDYDYCNEKNPCSIGEGHCDGDTDCKGNLKCGQMNCDRSLYKYSSTHYDIVGGMIFEKHDDCCYGIE